MKEAESWRSPSQLQLLKLLRHQLSPDTLPELAVVDELRAAVWSSWPLEAPRYIYIYYTECSIYSMIQSPHKARLRAATNCHCTHCTGHAPPTNCHCTGTHTHCTGQLTASVLGTIDSNADEVTNRGWCAVAGRLEAEESSCSEEQSRLADLDGLLSGELGNVAKEQAAWIEEEATLLAEMQAGETQRHCRDGARPERQ